MESKRHTVYIGRAELICDAVSSFAVCTGIYIDRITDRIIAADIHTFTIGQDRSCPHTYGVYAGAQRVMESIRPPCLPDCTIINDPCDIVRLQGSK